MDLRIVSRLKDFWQNIKESMWFLPLMISLGYFSVTFALYYTERFFPEFHYVSGIFYNGTVTDAKEVITALLSAMITMATLSISITMLVLSLAASQLGPRLIRIFMSSRKTQIYIGMFLGTVVACLTMTRILHDQSLVSPLPSLTITLVFGLCFINLFILIGFFHHVAKSSIADNIVTQVGRDLIDAIHRLSDDLCEIETPHTENTAFPAVPPEETCRIALKKSGYIRHIDYNALLELAEKHDLVIEINCKAGYYIISGEEIISAWPHKNITEDLEESIRSSFIIGNSRTSGQDIEYSIRHLVEIGLRALSPGINDHFTAFTVINHLSAAMAELFRRRIPENVYRDKNGLARVRGEQTDLREIICNAFSQIRVAGQDKPDIVRHLLLKLSVLYKISDEEEEEGGLKQVRAAIDEGIEKYFGDTATGKELSYISQTAFQQKKNEPASCPVGS